MPSYVPSSVELWHKVSLKMTKVWQCIVSMSIVYNWYFPFFKYVLIAVQ